MREIRRRGGKRSTGTREPIPVPDGPSKHWSLDFVSDVFGPARRFRILCVIDNPTRKCLALVADTSLSGAAFPGNSIDASGSMAGLKPSSRTMAVNRRRVPYLNGRTKPTSPGTISHPASRSKTVQSRASMGNCRMNAPMKKCSTVSPMPASSLSGGDTTLQPPPASLIPGQAHASSSIAHVGSSAPEALATPHTLDHERGHTLETNEEAKGIRSLALN